MPKLSDQLAILKAAGYEVPAPVEKYVKDREREQHGVAEVWSCGCGKIYESPVPLTTFQHGCGKAANRTWSNPLLL